MNIINCTPHVLNIVDAVGQIVKIHPSGTVARCQVSRKVAGSFEGINTFCTVYGDVVDLPEPSHGRIFVVSGLVRAQVPDRKDVYSPGSLIRDAEGKVIGCEGLDGN